MLDKLKSLTELFKTLGGDEPLVDAGGERLAVASLLVHAATADGQMDEVEKDRLKNILQSHYRLDEGDSDTLIDEATASEAEAVEIYGFTRVIQTNLAQEERQSIIRLMWQIAIADGEIHEFESNLIWRTAELIGVSARDRVHLRQDVLAQAEPDNG